jgi:flagellar biosynthesis regulator FlaF
MSARKGKESSMENLDAAVISVTLWHHNHIQQTAHKKSTFNDLQKFWIRTITDGVRDKI